MITMTSKIIDGKLCAKEFREQIESQVSKIQGRKPKLTVIIVGSDPASEVYVETKRKTCVKVGMESEVIQLPKEITQEMLIKEVRRLNNDPKTDGILVQLPLPRQISKSAIINAIDPSKDVDGFHPINMGKLLIGDKDGFIPCTPLGIQKLLEWAKIETEGKEVAILGRSTIVGKPLAALLMDKTPNGNSTVTIIHSRSKNIATLCKRADIVIASMGQAEMIDETYIKPGAIVIDVGINRVDDSSSPKGYKLVGDVHYPSVAPIAEAITPVPGGVGPMTIAMLLNNTLKSYNKREGISS